MSAENASLHLHENMVTVRHMCVSNANKYTRAHVRDVSCVREEISPDTIPFACIPHRGLV